MKTTRKGSAELILLLVAAVLVLIGGGVYFYVNKKDAVPSVVNNAEQNPQNNSFLSTSNTAPATVTTENTNAQVGISTKKATVVSTASTQPTAIPTKMADEVVIHGKAAKGIILNAKIRAVEVVDGKMSGIAKEVEIGSSGDFSVSMPKGIILLQVVTRNGSIEKDEVLGVDVPLPLDFRFRAAVDLVDVVAKSVEVNITAYSEVAVVVAEKNGGLLSKNINRANSGIANVVGVDFLGTKIIQSNDTVGLASATPAEKKMAVLNAAIADMASKDKMGCGAMQTYGEIINCTIAKFADQFSASNW